MYAIVVNQKHKEANTHWLSSDEVNWSLGVHIWSIIGTVVDLTDMQQ